MTAIVAVDFDWSIESCDKAPGDLDHERNTEKYGSAMKLTIDKKQNIICIIDLVCRDIIIYVDSLFWSGLSGLKCNKVFI